MTNLVYDYEPVPTVAEFAASDAFIRGLVGPFGSGKSAGSVIELANRGLAQRPGPDGIRRTRFAVVRNTYAELRDTTMNTVEQWLPERHFGRLYVADHRYVIRRFPKCEIEIIFRALDKPQDVKHLLSLELTGAWINEAREIPWAIIEALQGRVGRYPAVKDGGCTWKGIWMDTNPPDTDSAWYSFFEDRKWLKDFPKLIEAGILPPSARPEDYAAIFKQPSGRSPDAENLANLPDGRGYYVRLAIGKSAEWIKIYCDGEYGFTIDGKVIYPEYADGAHCKDIDPVPGVNVIRSWDFGLTPACAFSQLLPDGRWLTFDEMCSDNMGIDRFSDEVLEHCAKCFKGKAVFEDYGDPAGENRAETDERSCFEIMQNKGIKIEKAFSQVPTMRQEAVRSVLRTPVIVDGQFMPRFVLHSRCKVLRKGFMGGYHRRRLATTGERYSDKPEKNRFSHPHDALQYALVTYFGPQLVDQVNDDDYPEEPFDYAADATRSSVTGY